VVRCGIVVWCVVGFGVAWWMVCLVCVVHGSLCGVVVWWCVVVVVGAADLGF
jgi:hypothetical protein